MHKRECGAARFGQDSSLGDPILEYSCWDPRDLSYTEMLCVLVTLATSDTGATSPRPEHHRQVGRN
jgi:hypothetical protein